MYNNRPIRMNSLLSSSSSSSILLLTYITAHKGCLLVNDISSYLGLIFLRYHKKHVLLPAHRRKNTPNTSFIFTREKEWGKVVRVSPCVPHKVSACRKILKTDDHYVKIFAPSVEMKSTFSIRKLA